MRKAMDEFVHRQNILMLNRQLGDAPDDDRKRLLVRLLANEGAKVVGAAAPV